MPRVLELEAEADLPMARGQEEAARKFYGKVLGLREVMKAPGERGVWFEIAGRKLRLRVADAPAPPSEAVRARLTVDNVEGFRQAAVAVRARAWDAPAITGTKGVILSDPFGNRVELRQVVRAGDRARVAESSDGS